MSVSTNSGKIFLKIWKYLSICDFKSEFKVMLKKKNQFTIDDFAVPGYLKRCPTARHSGVYFKSQHPRSINR